VFIPSHFEASNNAEFRVKGHICNPKIFILALMKEEKEMFIVMGQIFTILLSSVTHCSSSESEHICRENRRFSVQTFSPIE
jgi:hypothetical protein